MTVMDDNSVYKNICSKKLDMVRAHSSTSPVVWRFDEAGKTYILKDFSRNRFLYRNIIGRFLLWREYRALSAFAGISGVPKIIEFIKGRAIITEEIKGKSLKNLDQEKKLPESFFEELKNLIDIIHDNGVAHCDLKSFGNIIEGEDGKPYIIDWGAAIQKKEFFIPPLNLIYERFLLDDYMAIIKIKLDHIPEKVTEEELLVYNNRSSAEKIIRKIRDRLRFLLKKVA